VDAQHLRQSFAISERHACELIGIAASTFRYRSERSDEALKEKLVRLAQEKPRFGYRRLYVLLRREGEQVNHKRVWRVYREAGLAVKRRRRKRLVRSGVPVVQASSANEQWALDFASDSLATGRSIRVLNVIDPANGSWNGSITGEVFGRKGHVAGKALGFGSPKR
jgi:putative transposase